MISILGLQQEPEGVAEQVLAGGQAGGVQGSAQDVGKVGGQAHRPKENHGLLHGDVSKSHRVSQTHLPI